MTLFDFETGGFGNLSSCEAITEMLDCVRIVNCACVYVLLYLEPVMCSALVCS